jgi:AMP-polyphosphate phosphotransferase
MFEAVELGRKLSKPEYGAELPDLRTGLLEAQQSIRKAGLPVVILIAGMDGAGKGTVVHCLNEWLDPRGIDTHTFWNVSGEEQERPYYWRFWRTLPARGRIGIYYGGWYADVLLGRVERRYDTGRLEHELARIAALERMLAEDGALILKFWFHLSRRDQQRRFKGLMRDPDKHQVLLPYNRKHLRWHGRFVAAAEEVIRRTDTGTARWHLVEATQSRYRDLTTGRLVLEALRAGVDRQAKAPPPSRRKPAPERRPSVTVLDRVDLDQQLTSEVYGAELKKLQVKLNRLAWKAHRRRISSILVFEGWDAAGKGSAIRRVTEAVDARLFRVVPVAAPTQEELAQHYLWRFWRHLPRAGLVTVFDRSWYGRVLVERVEGLASREAWSRAYHEINEFESQLTDHGTVLLKFWIHISAEEQLQRFKKREQVAHKQYKITPEDWRNRRQWGAYELAVHDLVTRTSTSTAPWMLVAGNDKRFARIEILRTFCRALDRAL